MLDWVLSGVVSWLELVFGWKIYFSKIIWIKFVYDVTLNPPHSICSFEEEIEIDMNALKVSLRVVLIHLPLTSVPSCTTHSSSHNVCTVSIIIQYSIDFPVMSFLRSILPLFLRFLLMCRFQKLSHAPHREYKKASERKNLFSDVILMDMLEAFFINFNKSYDAGAGACREEKKFFRPLSAPASKSSFHIWPLLSVLSIIPPFFCRRECEMIINRVRDAILGTIINLLDSSTVQRLYPS